MPMFDADQLVADCLEARSESEPLRAVKDVLDRALADADAVADAFRPTEGGLDFLHVSDELTVLHIVWAPGMQLFPHDHRMWAAIGIYTGREDNAFYRRPGPETCTLVETGGKELTTRDVLLLGDDVIHSVANPLSQPTGAIHVYGGDFVHQPRSQWGPGPREERQFDMDDLREQFAAANEAWRESVSDR
jgi:predicted metal-dependent enzyme (double-stranded beta helix superfamily)